MKPLKTLAGALLLLSILSCGKGEDSDLVITPTGTSAFLINYAAQSCQNVVAISKKADTALTKDVAPYNFSFQGLTLSWKNLSATAYIATIDFEFTSPVFTFKCQVSPDEVAALFYDFEATSNKDWNGALAPAASATTPTTRSTGSLCRIKCGGATIPDSTQPFVATGTMFVKGFQRTSNGDEKPIKASTAVQVFYQ